MGDPDAELIFRCGCPWDALWDALDLSVAYQCDVQSGSPGDCGASLSEQPPGVRAARHSIGDRR